MKLPNYIRAKRELDSPYANILNNDSAPFSVASIYRKYTTSLKPH